MYYDFFGFREPPFSIAPDPRYLYLSERHKEALAHLMYGVQGQGGFIVITGEVGTGKTTISRCFMENVPPHVDIALILNPKLSARELLSSICDELGIRHPAGSSIKRLIDLINTDLLEAHAAGRHKVLMIDEAQNLSPEVLEQLRLLTNLETAEKKLLQIVLLGQPELQDMLSKPELRQLSQRVTARYHLDAIERSELPAYLRYRLSVAGQRSEIFTPAAIRKLYRLSGGVPRLINLISDRALLGAYAEGEHRIEAGHIRGAAREVLGMGKRRGQSLKPSVRYASFGASIAVAVFLTVTWLERPEAETGATAAETDRVENPLAQDPEEGPETGEAADAGDAKAEKDEKAKDEKDAKEDLPADNQAKPAEPSIAAGQMPRFDPVTAGQSLPNAYKSLFSVWGVDYEPAAAPIACDYAEARGLRCLHRQGSWRSLERLNHPAILDLRDHAGEDRFVTLVGIDGNLAILATAEGERQVPVADIQRYWLGDYSILWQLPPYLSPVTDSGAAGAGEEIWLSARLMQLIELHASGSQDREQIQTMSQKEQIRWYQGRKGLATDGIAGAMTLIQVANDLDRNLPGLDRHGDEG
ncbi:AAA family ATPase [Marinobacter sp.]|uniref:AAA family ATPase n=1 Tax=Marinobacter sp. TaxID=50741 RepID=UPI0038507727